HLHPHDPHAAGARRALSRACGRPVPVERGTHRTFREGKATMTFWRSALVGVLVLGLGLPGAASAAGKGKPMVLLSTSMGDLKVELYADKAPVTVKNFLDYVKAGYYNGTIFHRVIPGFMIQSGGLTADMQDKREGQKAPLKNESGNGLKNDTGTPAMARTDDTDTPTSPSSLPATPAALRRPGGRLGQRLRLDLARDVASGQVPVAREAAVQDGARLREVAAAREHELVGCGREAQPRVGELAHDVARKTGRSVQGRDEGRDVRHHRDARVEGALAGRLLIVACGPRGPRTGQAGHERCTHRESSVHGSVYRGLPGRHKTTGARTPRPRRPGRRPAARVRGWAVCRRT